MEPSEQEKFLLFTGLVPPVLLPWCWLALRPIIADNKRCYFLVTRIGLPEKGIQMERHSSAMMFRKIISISCFIAVVAACATAQSSSAMKNTSSAIVSVSENGRKVWTNRDESAPTPAISALPKVMKYVYWSNQEHRWKTVPTPSQKQLQAARSAAQDVDRYVAQTPGAQLPIVDAAAANTVMNGLQTTGPGVKNAAIKIDPSLKPKDISQPKSMSERVDDAIRVSASKHGVDESLVRAIIQVESANNPYAISRKGAIGLMQLMPKTAHGMNVVNPFDPEQNVDAGVKHFKGLLISNNGNLALSLAAYNAGQGAVDRNGGVPPYSETKAYVNRITKLYGSSTPNAPKQTTGVSKIKVSRDQNGHLVFSNE